jgi:hypothetical protein
MKKVFYNYILLNPKKQGKYKYNELEFNAEPFYVGKGYKDRVFEHYKAWHLKTDTNIEKQELIKLLNNEYFIPDYIILNESTNEDFVLEQEIILISLIGRKIDKKGPLLNKNTGGEGNKGRLIKCSTRKKLSDNNRWKNKKGKLHSRSKPVYQYSATGKFIKVWENGSIAAETLNVDQSNIAICCLGKIKSAYGFHWSYINKGDQISFTLPKKIKKGKAVVFFNKDEKLEFNKISEAVAHFNLKSNSIIFDVIKGKKKQFRNYKIKYK